MEWFDDFTLDDLSSQDFIEDLYEEPLDEENTFSNYLNSNYDY